MTQEAFKLAIEALEGFIPYLPLKDEAQCNRYDKAIIAMKEALAQPEPVADDFFKMIADRNPKPFPLPQRTWVGLTDEDISEVVRGTHNTGSFVRAIEAKLKELNDHRI